MEQCNTECSALVWDLTFVAYVKVLDCTFSCDSLQKILSRQPLPRPRKQPLLQVLRPPQRPPQAPWQPPIQGLQHCLRRLRYCTRSSPAHPLRSALVHKWRARTLHPNLLRHLKRWQSLQPAQQVKQLSSMRKSTCCSWSRRSARVTRVGVPQPKAAESVSRGTLTRPTNRSIDRSRTTIIFVGNSSTTTALRGATHLIPRKDGSIVTLQPVSACWNAALFVSFAKANANCYINETSMAGSNKQGSVFFLCEWLPLKWCFLFAWRLQCGRIYTITCF